MTNDIKNGAGNPQPQQPQQNPQQQNETKPSDNTQSTEATIKSETNPTTDYNTESSAIKNDNIMSDNTKSGAAVLESRDINWDLIQLLTSNLLDQHQSAVSSSNTPNNQLITVNNSTNNEIIYVKDSKTNQMIPVRNPTAVKTTGGATIDPRILHLIKPDPDQIKDGNTTSSQKPSKLATYLLCSNFRCNKT